MRVGAKNIVLGSYSFFLSICFVPFFYGGSTNVRWIYLALTTPFFVLLSKLNKFTILHLIGLLFFIWSIITVLWSFNQYDSVNQLFNLLVLTQVFVLGSRLESLKEIFAGLALGLGFSSFAVYYLNMPGGLLVNPSMLGEAAILTIIGLIVYKLWWFIPIVLPSVFTGSRGVLLAGITTLIMWVWSKSKFLALSLIVPVFIAGFLSYKFDIRLTSVIERFDLWRDTFNGLSVFGQGVGSYHSAYPYYASLIDTFKQRPIYAHNDTLNILFELGIIGAILAIIFIGLLMKEKCNEKYIICCFITLSLFSFPFYMPVSAFVLAIVAGFVSRNFNNIFDQSFNSRMVYAQRLSK